MKSTLVNNSLLLFLVFLSITSCEKKKVLEITPENIGSEGPGGTYFGGDSVSTPKNPLNFEIVRYLTKIDTTYSIDSVTVMIGSITVSSPPEIRWTGTSGLPVTFRYSNGWSDTYKKWVGVDQMKISTKSEFFNEPISCVLTFDNKKIVERTTTVSLKYKDEIRDLFRINFGMNKGQVKQFEESRKIGGFEWMEYGSDLVQSNSSGKISNNIQFQFLNNQLTEVSEYGIDITSADFNQFIKTMGSPVVFGRVNNSIQPGLPQTWTKNGLKYTVQNKNVETTSGKKLMEVLTYAKAN